MLSVKITSESVESKIPLIWIGIIRLSIEYCETDENTSGLILYNFAKILLQISEDKGTSKWGRGLLSAIGINRQNTISVKLVPYDFI